MPWVILPEEFKVSLPYTTNGLLNLGVSSWHGLTFVEYKLGMSLFIRDML